MARKPVLIAAGLGAALALAAGIAYVWVYRSAPAVRSSVPPLAQGDCSTRTSQLVMKDGYLPGLVETGATFKATWNWYACHELRRGDLALLKVSPELDPLPRVVRAIEGDHFALVRDPGGEHWNLEVNGEVQKDYHGTPYFFGGKPPPPLSLYVEARKGVLRQGEVIVLATRSPGNLDSGALGIVSVKDLLGRVELKR